MFFLSCALFCVGGIAGAAMVYWVAPHQWVEDTHLGMNLLKPGINMFQGLAVEIIGTMILVLLVLVISDPDPKKDFEVRKGKLFSKYMFARLFIIRKKFVLQFVTNFNLLVEGL